MNHVVPCSFVIHHDGYNQTAAAAAAASQLNCTALLLRSFLSNSRDKLNIKLWEKLITAYCKVCTAALPPPRLPLLGDGERFLEAERSLQKLVM